MVDERLEEAIVRQKVSLLILDPIQAYLGGGTDMNRANEARDMTKKLGALAEKTGCAIVLISHMNKGGGGKAAYRGMGSIDFFAVARSVILVGRIEGQEQMRAVYRLRIIWLHLDMAKLLHLRKMDFVGLVIMILQRTKFLVVLCQKQIKWSRQSSYLKICVETRL
jgi:hypothetical protein